jgi:hypothetical protein
MSKKRQTRNEIVENEPNVKQVKKFQANAFPKLHIIDTINIKSIS